MESKRDVVLALARGVLVEHEGIRQRPYEDSLGHCTIGVGHLLHLGACTASEKHKQYTMTQVFGMLQRDVVEAYDIAKAWVPKTWDSLKTLEQLALTCMAFQLGNKINQFVNTRRILETQGLVAASEAMKESRWYRQTPKRVEFIIGLAKYG